MSSQPRTARVLHFSREKFHRVFGMTLPDRLDALEKKLQADVIAIIPLDNDGGYDIIVSSCGRKPSEDSHSNG